MPSPSLRLTYVGGPTALLEWGGARLLTDPTFDPAGEEYRTRAYVLRKTRGPAFRPDELGRVDAVLLSHDQHFDNLDRLGRQFLTRAATTFTTPAGAERLGGAAIGLEPWERRALSLRGVPVLRITATPARHGPAGLDRGPVIGFALECVDEPGKAVYVSGDTVWFEGLREVAARFEVVAAVLFLGAARVSAVSDRPLTFSAAGAVEAARSMPGAAIVPLHFEDWKHFSEGREDVDEAFRRAGLSDRLRWPVRGGVVVISVPAARPPSPRPGRSPGDDGI